MANDDPAEQLKKLSDLRAQGVLTEAEFTAAKAKVLGAVFVERNGDAGNSLPGLDRVCDVADLLATFAVRYWIALLATDARRGNPQFEVGQFAGAKPIDAIRLQGHPTRRDAIRYRRARLVRLSIGTTRSKTLLVGSRTRSSGRSSLARYSWT